MKKSLTVLLLILFVGLGMVTTTTRARVLLPLSPDLEITDEERQVGLLWNGEEQITIDRMILEIEESGKLLAIMPLSSATTHTYQDESVMEKARYNFKERKRSMSLPDYFYEPGPEYQEMTSVATKLQEITAQEDLKAAVEDFLAEEGFAELDFAAEKLTPLEDYINRGYNWLSFAILDLDSGISAQVSSWRFVTPKMFYPLETGRDFTVKFTALLSDPRPDFESYGWQDFDFYIPPQITPPAKIAEIHPYLGDFFPGVMVHTHYWEISSPAEGFTDDLLVTGEDIRDLLRKLRPDR